MSERAKRLEAVLETLSLVAAAGFVACYLGIAVSRLGYPFELEWMEGGTVDHVGRLLEGLSLYVRPSADFVPYLYPPLYYALAWPLASALGLGFLPLRLLSFACSLACMALVFALVRSQTRNPRLGLLGVGFFAACFPLSGAFYDLARVDSLFLLLSLTGALFARGSRPTVAALASATAFSLAFLTKQAALIIAIAFVPFLAVRGRRALIAFGGTLAVLCVVPAALLDRFHDGWYRYYVFVLPHKHTIDSRVALAFWTRDLLQPLGLATLFALLPLLRSRWRGRSAFLATLAAGFIGAAYLVRVRNSSYTNTLIPAFAALSVLCPIGVGTALSACRAAGRLRVASALVVRTAVLLQLAALTYGPMKFVPTAADRTAGASLIALLRDVDGPVLVLSHGHLAAQAGKHGSAQSVACSDVLEDRRSSTAAALVADFREAAASRRWALVVVDADDWLAGLLKETYHARGRVFDDPAVFWPVTGVRTRPDTVYQPREK